MAALQRRACILAVAAQVGLLAAWSTGRPWPLASTLGVAVAGLVLAVGGQGAERVLRRPLFLPLTLGGLGMLLGAWFDAHFAVPPCLCCHWGRDVPATLLMAGTLWTWSSLGMALGCGAAMSVRRAGVLGRARFARCIAEGAAMWLGMLLLMRPATTVLRQLPAGKLAFGHLAMVLGMALGTLACAALHRAWDASAKVRIDEGGGGTKGQGRVQVVRLEADESVL